MDWYCIISITLSIILFTTYNAYGLVHYRLIPIHLSASYYYLHDQKLSWLFPCLIWMMMLLIIPVWIIINLRMQLPHMTYLICIVGGMLFCIGLLREYQHCKVRRYLHYFTAYTAGILTLFWIHFSCPTEYRYIPRILLIIFVVIGLCTRTAIRSFRYWIELVAFYSIMIVLLLLSLSLL